MGRDERPRFRTTLWPSGPVGAPAVERSAHVARDGAYIEQRRDPSAAAPLPPELVIRELPGLDLDDPDAVVGFLQTHGIINRPNTDLHGPAAYLTVEPNEPRPDNWSGYTWSTAALWLRTARSLAAHWALAETGGDVIEAWADWGERFGPRVAITEPDMAWAAWAADLNVGLGVLRVRVETQPFGQGTVTVGRPAVSLYSGLCVQLFNLLAEGDSPRHCANETCGGWFVRQAGRAEHGQHRSTGVKFCSKSCARAQAERERRRRNRKENR